MAAMQFGVLVCVFVCVFCMRCVCMSVVFVVFVCVYVRVFICAYVLLRSGNQTNGSIKIVSYFLLFFWPQREYLVRR